MSIVELVEEGAAISPDTSVLQVVRLMTERKVGAISVVEKNQIVGIFTERDLMTRVVAAERNPATTLVRSVMTSPVHTISSSASVEQAAVRMRSKAIRRLVVVDDDGALRGMVALESLIVGLVNRLERKVDGLEAELMADGPGG